MTAIDTALEFIHLSGERRRSHGALAKLDSVIEVVESRMELTIDRASCENIAACGFRGDNLPLAIVATDILLNEQPITLRGLFYRVVSAGWLPSTEKKHSNRLGRLMTRLREAGIVPFSWIVDGVRSTDKPSSWSGLADYARSVRDCYRLDFWGSMPHYVHFIVEKDAIAGVLAPVTREYDIRLSPIRGYCGLSFAHDEIAELWNQIDKPIFCYYLGDFDPSGFDLERDIREKLKRYCNKSYWFGEGEKDDEGPAGDAYLRESMDSDCVLFRRLGVLESDFVDFDLLPLAVKKKDPRAVKFRKRYGDRCAEIDALPASELRRRVRDTIESHITKPKEWERLKKVETAERQTLEEFIKRLEGAA